MTQITMTLARIDFFSYRSILNILKVQFQSLFLKKIYNY